MPSFGQMTRALAAEISIEANTGPGAAQASADFARVGDAAEKAATVSERTTEVQTSAARAYQRLQKYIDPLATAQERLAKDQDTLRRAFEQGLISADRYADNLGALDRQFERVKDRIERTEKAQDGLNRETSRFGDVAQRLGPALAGIAAGFSLDVLRDQVREAVADLDELAKRARSLGGIGQGDFLQSGSFALGQLGIEDGGRALTEFNRRTAQALAGRGEGVGLLRELDGGEALLEQIRNAASLEAQFLLVADALSKIEDAQQRVLVGNAFFGEELGARVGALGEAGAEGFRALQAEAKAAGLVLDADVLTRAEELNDRFSKASQIIDTQLKRALIDLGPAFAGAAEQAAGFLTNLLDRVERLNRQRRIALNEEPIRIGVDLSDIEATREALFEVGEQITIARARLEAAANPGSSAARGANIAGIRFDPAEVEVYARELDRLVQIERELEDVATNRASPVSREDRVTAKELAAFLGVGADKAAELDRNAAAASRSLAAARDAFRVQTTLGDDVVRAETLLRVAETGGPEALAAAERRLEIEDRIARLRVEAARLGLALDEDALEAEIRRLDAVNARLDAIRRGDRDGAAGGASAEAAAAEADLRGPFDRVLDAFWRGFRADGRAAIDETARDAEGAFGGIFTPGINGPSPANRAAQAALGVFGAATPADFAQGLGAAVTRALQTEIARAGLFEFTPGAGKANVLNLAADALASIDPRLAAIIGPGRAGVAAANLIDGNGANPTTAAVGQFFGPIGGLLAGLFSKASREGAGAVFRVGTGEELTFGQKRQTEASEANRQIVELIVGQTTEVTRLVERLANAAFFATPSAANENFLNITADNRDIRVGFQGADGLPFQPAVFEAGQLGAEEAIREAIRLTLSRTVTDGTRQGEAVVQFVDALAGSKVAIDEFAGRVQTVGDILRINETSDPLADILDRLDESFRGLDRSVAGVAASFDAAADEIGRSVTEGAQRGILAEVNPLAADVEDLLDQIDARNRELDRLAAQGGDFDASLVAEFQRRQLLALFQLEGRFERAADPAAAAIRELVDAQAGERDALRRAIERSNGLIDERDFNGLLRAQEAERFAAFRNLAPEDRARLAGRAGEFDDLTNAYALAVERFVEESRRLVDGFEDERRRLSQIVSDRSAEIASLDDSIRRLELARGGSTPGESVASLREQVADLAARAESGDPEDAAFARRNLSAAVDALIARAEAVFGGASATTASLSDFGLEALRRARDAASDDRDAAQQQLDVLEQTRDLTSRLVELASAPRLDIAAILEVVGRLDPSTPIRDLALQLAELEARRTAQEDRFNGLIETLGPSDVGLGDPVSGAAPVAVRPPAAFTGGDVPPSTAPVVPAANDDGAAVELLADIAERLYAIEQGMAASAKAARASEVRRERHLGAIARSA